MSQREMQGAAKKQFSLASFSLGSVNSAARGSPTPERQGRQGLVPADVQKGLAFCVRSLRKANLPVFRADVLLWLEGALDGTGLAMPVNLDAWYVTFLERYNLKARNLRPLDVKREQWYTEANLEAHYNNMQAILLKYKYAVKNVDYDPAVPYSQPIILTSDGLDHLMEFDESSFKVSEADTAKKTGTEKIIGDDDNNIDNGESIVEHSSSDRCSAVGGSTARGVPLRPGFCFNSGETFDPNWFTDDSGKPITIPTIDDTTGELFEAIYDCNKKGSYKVVSLINYLDSVQRQLPKATAEKPVIAFLDGVYTHIHLDVLLWMQKHHYVLMLKVPYLSFVLQGCDVKGGPFRRIKPEWRVKLQQRLRAKRLGSLQTNAASAVSLGFEDIIPCLREAWMKAFTQEKLAKTWATIGIYPFTCRALWDFRKKYAVQLAAKMTGKKRAAATVVASANLINVMKQMTSASEEGAKKKKKKGGRMNAGAVWSQFNGEATHTNCVAQQEAKAAVDKVAADKTAAGAAATAAAKKVKEETAKALAETVWPLYITAHFKYDTLAVGLGQQGHVLAKEKVVAVLVHKLGKKWVRREKKPSNVGEWRALLKAELEKPGVVAALGGPVVGIV
jgi:hypothetical protein